ncbi:MAG TPA: AraC family transcriptional regulator [Pedobacter sp.]|nr:AraC family transcriptional regulator [Pedobacter sp.]
MNNTIKRRDGFTGEKMISIPSKIWREAKEKNPSIFHLFLTHIGYFPRAAGHYRERRKGCEDNILIYCLQGKGHLVIGNEKHVIHPNEYILLPATDQYIRYQADKKNPWTIYWVHFSGDDIHLFNKSLNLDNFKKPIAIPFSDHTISIWQNIYQTLEMGYSLENLCSAAFCLHHLLAIFLFPQRHISSDKEEDLITQTIIKMRSNLNKKLTVEDMALQHGLSVSHFSSIFRKSTGFPPIDYFIHLKMQQASQQLYTSNDKIKIIAAELGYEDPYYFSRVFKKYIGTSPEQYRLSANTTG